MDFVNGEHVKKSSPESDSLLAEGISLILSRWTGLELALAYRSYDRYSRGKVEQLSNDIFSWFTQSKEPLYVDDLENLLRESMLLFFDTLLDDDSDEDVATHLMIMHEECLQGKYETIEKLRKSSRGEVVSRTIQVVNEDEDNDDAGGLNDEVTEMLVDEQKERITVEAEDLCLQVAGNEDEGNVDADGLVNEAEEMLLDEKKERKTVEEAEDGWCVVTTKTKRKTKRTSGLKQCY
ncbi:Pre-rRNA-processing protein TSR2 [Macleaya cordata]|uniref:Pre-rRNA-processing protein TSR2 n=1 Tax=Macleaya cordata TaxID=56857 RepID=A0A200Q2P5_MACCD|nr:Pre-rRNA-processing protein TSR2 [Macleaya cordata]